MARRLPRVIIHTALRIKIHFTRSDEVRFFFVCVLPSPGGEILNYFLLCRRNGQGDRLRRSGVRRSVRFNGKSGAY